ncbi:phosphate ABC transporter substrate-binding protein [Ferrimonas balearica]|uniref:phosphate ABC transporter substrate-binding protein n=1 Tax=Ferrimonas balearica TaxID=44012 RepID=UPI001C99DE0C|nr:phosphate ABC transporter substrate-binding protein [Ferrimonas balearica]MBY5992078.1 phosphate ABC transporter substrate-binding protein [Ferrimonas balearica]
MKKFAAGALALFSMFTASSAIAGETITVSGSNSMTSLMEVLAETYTKKTGNFVEVQGPGSSAGIRAANQGTSHIGMASRAVADSEVEAGVERIIIANDGIAVVVHPSNKIENLTTEQVAAIYRGEIKDWSEVGGEKAPIVAVTRDSASGTRAGFEDVLGLKQTIAGKKVSAISPRAQVANGNGMVKTTSGQNPRAIGYISLGTVDGSVKALDINGVDAAVANVQNQSYPVARSFVLMTGPKTPQYAQAFIDWILSEEGQSIVAQKGYVPAK